MQLKNKATWLRCWNIPCWIGLFFYCLISTAIQAQEQPKVLSSQWNNIYPLPTFSPADTARLLKMISAGVSLRDTMPDSAIAIYRKVVKESKTIGFTDGVAGALLNTGVVYMNGGIIDSALQYFLTALSYCHNVYYAKLLGPAVYHNIGTIYTLRNNFKIAAQYYDSAIQEGIRVGLSEDRLHLVNTYINIGIVHAHLQQYDRALFYMDKGEQISRRKGYQEQLALVLKNKGTVYKFLKQYDKARIHYLQSLTIADTNLQRSIYTELAEILQEQGKTEEASYYWEKITQVGAIHNPVFSSAKPNLAMGNSFLRVKNYIKAEQYLLAAQQYAEQQGPEDIRMNTIRALSELYEQTDRPVQALQQLKSYEQLKDSIFNKEKIKDINELDIKYQSAEKDKQILLKEAAVRKRDIWIGISISSILILLALLLLLYRQKKQVQAIIQMKAVIKGEEQERERIAQELHDGIGGMLAAIKMGLSHLENKPASGQPYTQLVNIVEATALEVRRTAHNLIPTVLERNSLQEALHQYCTSLSQKEGLQIETHFNGPIEALNKNVILVIYRIVQELLQNVVKHAGANHADVQITRQDDKLDIIVEDNGIGFNIKENSNGIGLQNLQHRVQALHGQLSIDSQQGKSTMVFIEFDLKKLASVV